MAAPFPRKTSATVCRPWKHYVFPYPGRQTIVNSRNVMRSLGLLQFGFYVFIFSMLILYPNAFNTAENVL
jgi:hypothetical protein